MIGLFVALLGLVGASAGSFWALREAGRARERVRRPHRPGGEYYDPYTHRWRRGRRGAEIEKPPPETITTDRKRR